ncbi:MAG: pantoate--beta-alanine ligase [Planctomycetota bacterium]|nr:pantoate--beta-alanine ligase [Planctomycetota bacterium]MDP6763572.1 pantoate--beta-alanine ligase [Planctomycetota bacterium]MDP6988213.1 pantoate--beta-alanine ligase [Planctomycetota bacterium]
MIELLDSPAEARAWCALRRERGERIGFVPTMGALHVGHLSLVERAVAENDAVCVSVFVNPLQFDDPRDLERYPRDLEGDARLLEGAGAAMVFTGTLAQFFPGELAADGSLAPERLVDPGPAAAGLEGAFRTGHFEGVATIVARLFDLVEPARVYFGRKDYQQALVVDDLARRRGGPRVVVCDIVREPTGLACSSRNALLSEAGRARAACLSRSLEAVDAAWREGARDAEELAALLREGLARDGVELDYAELRDPLAWSAEAPTGLLERAVALVAARVDGVRLIDNLELGAGGVARA